MPSQKPNMPSQPRFTENDTPQAAAQRVVHALLKKYQEFGTIHRSLPEEREGQKMYSTAVSYPGWFPSGKKTSKLDEVLPLLKEAFKAAYPESYPCMIDVPIANTLPHFPVLGINRIDDSKAKTHHHIEELEHPAVVISCFDEAQIKTVLTAMQKSLQRPGQDQGRGA